MCDKGFNWNPSKCECERDKSCDVGEYFDYKNGKCRKKLIDKLVEGCSDNIDEKNLLSSEITNVTLNKCKNAKKSCIIYTLLFAIFLIISVSISSVFNYFHCYLKRKYIETTIY